MDRHYRAVRPQRDLLANHQMLFGIGKGRAIADQYLPGIARLQIEHHQAALVSGIGEVGIMMHGIDPYIVQRIFRRDHALEIILPDHFVVG